MANRPAEVRFYVDADTLGLAQILTRLRDDVTFPGDPGGVVHNRVRPACTITTDTADTDWIKRVSSDGWLIITRDKRIAKRHLERQAVITHSARVIAVTSREPLNNWGILEIVMTQWRWIEETSELPGPFIYGITRTARRSLL